MIRFGIIVVVFFVAFTRVTFVKRSFIFYLSTTFCCKKLCAVSP